LGERTIRLKEYTERCATQEKKITPGEIRVDIGMETSEGG